MDKDKYKQLVQEEIKSKHLIADEGYQYDIFEQQQKKPVSTSITSSLKKLFIGGLITFCCIMLVICSVFNYQLRRKQRASSIDREAELANIRQRQSQDKYKQQIWKNINGLSQVDEEGESYVTAHSDYRRGSNNVPIQDYYSQPAPPMKEADPVMKAPAGNKFSQRYKYQQQIDDEDDDEFENGKLNND